MQYAGSTRPGEPWPQHQKSLQVRSVFATDFAEERLPDFLPAQQYGFMGRSATSIVNEFAVRPDLVRRAIAQHRTWIEQQLGVPLSDVVILESELDIAQIGIELLLSLPPAQRPT